MNSKERVRIAMSGGIPDRVPVVPQLCPPHAIRVSGFPFEETAVDWLRNPRKYDLFEAECARNYGFDGVRVWLGSSPRTIEWKQDTAYEIDPRTGEQIGIVDFKGGCSVLRLPSKKTKFTEKDIGDIPVIPWEELLESEAMIPVQKVIAKYGKDMFIIGPVSSFTLETLTHSQGMESTLMDIVERPDFIKHLTERQLDASIQQAIAFAKVGVDAIYIGETLGGFLSQENFSELCLPYFKRFVKQVRSHGPLIYLHMCGQVTHLLELMVETDVDCVEPMDELGGTRVADVKKRIGDRVSLMGGVNVTLLSHGSLQDVKNDCIRCIREAGGGGGYILAACDMLPTETSPEKVRAMIVCAKTFGRYDREPVTDEDAGYEIECD